MVLALVGSQAHGMDDLKQLTVKSTATGAPVRVSDLAEVVRAAQPVYTFVSANGKPAVLLNIARQPASNTVAVADGVAAEVTHLRKEAAARSHARAVLRPVADCTGEYHQCARCDPDRPSPGLRHPLSVPARLAFICSLRVYDSGNCSRHRAGPMALGQSFNLMTLGGLAAAIGLVIDDAIVVVENIVLHRDAGEVAWKLYAKLFTKFQPANRFDDHSGRCVPSPNRRDRRNRQLLSCACHYDGCLTADVPGFGRDLDPRTGDADLEAARRLR